MTRYGVRADGGSRSVTSYMLGAREAYYTLQAMCQAIDEYKRLHTQATS